MGCEHLELLKRQIIGSVCVCLCVYGFVRVFLFVFLSVYVSGAGLHRRARQVLDIDRVYFMMGEDLGCSQCKATYVSWSQTILQQLDLSHRLEFRVILTRK